MRRSRNGANNSMDLRERNGSETTARHPWELARAEFLSMIVDARIVGESPVEWLDVGSGDGWLAHRLLADLPDGSGVTCWDENYQDTDLDEFRMGHPESTFVSRRPAATFDLISLFDVLEHVEDDQVFLASVVENCLRPGGLVILSVPAYGALYTRHDTALGHFRRYEPSRIRHLLDQTGLTILQDGGLFTSLLPVRLAQVALERLTRNTSEPTGVGAWEGGQAATEAIRYILAVDSKLSLWLSERNVSVPGLSYWAVCRK